MIASAEKGIQYLTAPAESVKRYCDFITHVPEMSVAHRFGLAVLYKFSTFKDYASQMLDMKIDNYILEFIDAYNPKKCHSYFPIFYTALAYNLLTNATTREKVSKFTNRYAPFCVKLLEFFKQDLPSAAHQNILEMFKFMLTEKEVYYRDLMIEARAADTLKQYFSSLQSIFKGNYST